MTPATRAATTLGAMAVALGAVGLVVADGSFADSSGTLIGWAHLELVVASLNRLGALATLAGGGLALVGARLRSRAVVRAAAALFGAMAVQVLVQWGRADNLLGGRGSNLSLWAAFAVGLAAVGGAFADPSKRSS